MAEQYDVAIVGGGIGGGALGTALARADKRVLVLERAAQYRDRVRGEWMAPWGILEAKKLGLYDDLISAGAHHLSKHVSCDAGGDAAEAFASPLDMTALVPGVPGPLCIGHPKHCEVLAETAAAAGATFLRGVSDVSVSTGAAPSVTYTHDGATTTATCRLLVGADGRGSLVRRAAGIELHEDPQHHFFSGMLIEGAHGWPDDLQVIGADKDVHYLVFPQGNGRVRLYIGFESDDPQRFAGADGPQKMLEAFRIEGLPGSEHIANATPAGPCNAYPNQDAWTDTPYAEGVVLIGDAAGYNDPIIGQGLSITYTDARIVRDALLENEAWAPEIFAAYAEERAERLRRLRFSAALTSTLMDEFGPEAEERRKVARARQEADPSLSLSSLAAIVGPHAVPAVAFEDATRERLFAPA